MLHALTYAQELGDAISVNPMLLTLSLEVCLIEPEQSLNRALIEP